MCISLLLGYFHGMSMYAYVHVWNSQENDTEMENGVFSLRGTQCAERI